MTWNWANKRQFIRGIKCNGCHYTYDWFAMNEADGKYYCGGCNLDLKDPGSKLSRKTEPTTGGRPTQEFHTFTSNYESEDDKKNKEKNKEKPNLKPVEEEDENYLLGIDPDIFEEKPLTDEEKDKEATSYNNNIPFRAYLKKIKGLPSLSFHVFRYDLKTMRHYFNEFQQWQINMGGTSNIPRPKKITRPAETPQQPEKPNERKKDEEIILSDDDNDDNGVLKTPLESPASSKPSSRASSPERGRSWDKSPSSSREPSVDPDRPAENYPQKKSKGFFDRDVFGDGRSSYRPSGEGKPDEDIDKENNNKKGWGWQGNQPPNKNDDDSD